VAPTEPAIYSSWETRPPRQRTTPRSSTIFTRRGWPTPPARKTDEKWGERPKAFVELREGESATPQEILDFARQHLAGYKRPAAVELTQLPRTATGKLQKNLLREKEWAGREKRIG
jgi:AMP-binding enzyme C-terminal domain